MPAQILRKAKSQSNEWVIFHFREQCKFIPYYLVFNRYISIIIYHLGNLFQTVIMYFIVSKMTRGPGAISLTYTRKATTLIKSVLQYQIQYILMNKYSRSCTNSKKTADFLDKYQAPFVDFLFVRKKILFLFNHLPLWPHLSLGNHGLIKL